MAKYCDPPSGWRYGFPRVMPKDVAEDKADLIEWLIDCGYPSTLIESYGKHFYIRFWEDNDGEKEASDPS